MQQWFNKCYYLLAAGYLYILRELLWLRWNTAKSSAGHGSWGNLLGIFNFQSGDGNVNCLVSISARTGRICSQLFLQHGLLVVFGKTSSKSSANAVDIIVTPLITVLVVSIVTMFSNQPLAGFLIRWYYERKLMRILNIGGRHLLALLAGTFLPLVIGSDCIHGF